ncbi:MAG: DUF6090 family protein [Balneolaceae bacterium]|nr:DUF6090 family protein [Balneolaceae bacterium]
MITLFRRIRQKLIDSGSVGKYLLYAIGEILLVVIGILIALQVNNWNQERLDYQKSIEYHQRLISDLDFIMEAFESDSVRADEVLKSLNEAVEILESGVLTDSAKVTLDFALNTFFQFTRITTELTSYEEMKSTGQLGLIYNTELREAISNYLTRKEAISKIYDQLSEKVDDTKFIDQYVRVVQTDSRITPDLQYEFSDLSSDPLVINTLARYGLHWRSKKYFSAFLKSRALELKAAVEAELEEL